MVETTKKRVAKKRSASQSAPAGRPVVKTAPRRPAKLNIAPVGGYAIVIMVPPVVVVRPGTVTEVENTAKVRRQIELGTIKEV